MFNENSEESVWTPKDNVLSPLPLFRELPPALPYPMDALGMLSAVANSLKQSIQAPDAIVAQSLLAAAALAVQAHGDVVIHGRRFPTSIFALSVGASGERKSQIDSEALNPHRAYEHSRIMDVEMQMKIFRCDNEVYEQAKKVIFREKKTKTQIADALKDLGDPPQQPYSEIMLMEEPTYEGLVKSLTFGRASVGLFSDEGGRMVGGHGMSADNQLKTAAGFSSMWDGKPISRVRQEDGSTKLYGKRLALHLMLQPRISQLLTSNETLADQGLLARCLIAAPESTVGKRPYKKMNLSEDANVLSYRKLMLAILKEPLPYLNKSNILKPKELQLSNSQEQSWIRFHDYVETNVGEGKPFYSIKGFACKAAEHALRIAGVLALTEDIKTNEIKKNHLDSAIELVNFYLSEALRLHNTSVLNPELVQAHKLFDWCQRFSEVHLVQIYQYGPAAVRDKTIAKKLVDILEGHNCLRRVDGKIIDGQFRKDVWQVVK